MTGLLWSAVRVVVLSVVLIAVVPFGTVEAAKGGVKGQEHGSIILPFEHGSIVIW